MSNLCKKNIVCLIIGILIGVAILWTIYPIVDKEVPNASNEARVQLRDIETPTKLIFNGYLGLFFRFQYIGNTGWLILPLLIYFLFTIKKRERWQMALIFVWSAAALFLAVKGYTNLRYQMTLFPVTVVGILLLLWDLLKDKKKYIQMIVFSVLALASIYNIYRYREEYQGYYDLKITRTKTHFPDKIIDYINQSPEVNDQARVYVIEQPFFYYHCKKLGVDYQDPARIWSFIELIKKENGDRNQLFNLFKRDHVGYLLMQRSEKIKYETALLNEFLICECRQVLEDNGWYLFKIGKRPLEEQLSTPPVQRIPVWNELGTTVKELSPELFRYSKIGQYNFNVRTINKEQILEVSYASSKLKKGALINFGYEFKPYSLNMPIPEGKYIHFIARISSAPNIVNPNNFLMVSQFRNNQWTGPKVNFKSPFPQTLYATMKVDGNVQRLLMGFRFVPQSPNDSIKIHYTGIFISDEIL